MPSRWYGYGLVVVTAWCVMAGAAEANTISSHEWRVVDGDTIHVPNHKLRLAGIDAPEAKQHCQSETGGDWACGKLATDMLTGLLIDEISCELDGQDRYRRDIATCFSAGLDVQKVLVRVGLAVAEYGDQYKADEDYARQNKHGMWAGEFLRPRDWRRRK